ncbi:hypothetical protein PaecuDRAFT_2819 [Paenibacillus curdlanolyticus YK9]|uniref:Uncharacterized protein n=1 Tax=Paenibacillus curdlanolyticus YK9 TaxID=717606 RepID=E0IB92_9BACL|nr:hypothetical protein [Paenibacillus curdlanolyticus]EFM08366.1 hypothetical protein PaecuDRAFT_4830 [Paenibacillus curdlanolyticus YK9]EFM10383.1 hypothetical protein PaecuDRAFT_2819 [Paenibacillus curdlanolyticus YK9]
MSYDEGMTGVMVRRLGDAVGMLLLGDHCAGRMFLPIAVVPGFIGLCKTVKRSESGDKGKNLPYRSKRGPDE